MWENSTGSDIADLWGQRRHSSHIRTRWGCVTELLDSIRGSLHSTFRFMLCDLLILLCYFCWDTRGSATSPLTAAGLLSSSSSSSSMSTPPLLAIASCSFASSTSFDVPKYLQRMNVERQKKENYKMNDYWQWPTCKSHSLLLSPWHQGSQSDQRSDQRRLPPPTFPANNTWHIVVPCSINCKRSGVLQNKCQLSSCIAWCFLFTCMYFLNWFLSWFLFSVDLQVVLQCQKLQNMPRPWKQQKQ